MSTALVLRNQDAFVRIGAIAEEAIAILTDSNANEFVKGYAAACAMQQLKTQLSDDVMKPIMALQGSSLGFVTDRDRDGGYDLDTVRNCAITAALSGLRFHGNEWNIISGRCYVTVNGCDRLFNGLCETAPRHEPDAVVFDENARRATVRYKITYKLRWQFEQTREQTISVKLVYSKSGFLLTTDDAVLGKARRKMLWSLLRELRGIELGEGEIERPSEKNVTPPRTTSVEAKPFAVEETP